MRTVISQDGLRDFEPSDNVIKKKQGNNFSIFSICRHILNPFCEIIDGHDNITMPLDVVGLKCMKSMPHLEKGPPSMMGWSGAGWVFFLDWKRWHGGNFFTASIQSLNIDGKKDPTCRILWVVAIPKRWPPQALEWNSFNKVSTSSWVKQCLKIESMSR